MDHRFTWALAAGLSAGLSGCFSLGLEGDRTSGDEGRSVWWISDGLCPGLGGQCAMDVPIAAGAAVNAAVERDDDTSLAGHSVAAEGAVSASGLTIDPASDEDDRDLARFVIGTTAPGQGSLVLLEPDGELDRVGVEVRQATQLECGLRDVETELLYDMASLQVADSLTLPLGTADETVQLVCRALDADGEPLLTVMAIEWEVVEGSEALAVRTDLILSAFGTRATGARIHAQALAAGTARVRATLGDVTRELEITVE